MKLSTPIALQDAPGCSSSTAAASPRPVYFSAIAARLAFGTLTAPVYGVLTRHFVGSGEFGSSGIAADLERREAVGDRALEDERQRAHLDRGVDQAARAAVHLGQLVGGERNAREHEVDVLRRGSPSARERSRARRSRGRSATALPPRSSCQVSSSRYAPHDPPPLSDKLACGGAADPLGRRRGNRAGRSRRARRRGAAASAIRRGLM